MSQNVPELGGQGLLYREPFQLSLSIMRIIRYKLCQNIHRQLRRRKGEEERIKKEKGTNCWKER
jgi:hypothetical protein